MDNTSIRHHATLGYVGGIPVQTYVQTGRIVLDFNGLYNIAGPIEMSECDAEDLAAIILAAIRDKER